MFSDLNLSHLLSHSRNTSWYPEQQMAKDSGTPGPSIFSHGDCPPYNSPVFESKTWAGCKTQRHCGPRHCPHACAPLCVCQWEDWLLSPRHCYSKYDSNTNNSSNIPESAHQMVYRMLFMGWLWRGVFKQLMITHIGVRSDFLMIVWSIDGEESLLLPVYVCVCSASCPPIHSGW